jgi:hypothetical protein
MSDTKEEFYAVVIVPIDRDIINQAVWGSADSQWSPWFPDIHYVENGDGNVESVTVVCWDPDKEEGEIGKPLSFDVSEIAGAIRDIMSGKHGNGHVVRDIRQAVLENDAGNIDALGSDFIMQVVCYKEIIFG